MRWHVCPSSAYSRSQNSIISLNVRLIPIPGEGGYSRYILVGPRCGHSPKRGVLGAGTAPKKGGLRCGHNQKRGDLRHIYNPKNGEFRTDFVKREGVGN